MSKQSLVVASNRLPINISRTEGGFSYDASSGGLTTAMSSVQHENKIWVGWPGIASDDLTNDERSEISEELSHRGFVPVFLSNEEINLYYEGYANDTIWPLFHYFQSLARYEDAYWEAYESVNKKFAEAIIQASSPDSLIWIHDYHLMLTPKMIRDATANVSISFFLHIPFPSFEIFRIFPQRTAILEGLLGADIVGFHIYDYGRHFLSSCMRLLGLSSQGGIIDHDGRRVKVTAYPIGIDYDKFQKELSSKQTRQAADSLRSMYGKQTVVLSMDRLDYSKGIPERLEAFRIFLEEYPEFHGNVTLVMIAVPSRINVEAYKQLRDEIEMTVSRINGMYGTVDWAPISYQFQNRPFSEIVALFARSDVALVTPIRDGMNLVAKEYVASKRSTSGVLILSEMAGAIDELPEALSINPKNVRSIANALHEALVMPKREKNQRMDAMRKRIKQASVQQWAMDSIDDLEDVSKSHDKVAKKLLKGPQIQSIISQFRQANSRLIILDYDGTLKKFVNTPSPLAATPSLGLRTIIKRLSEQPNTTVAIVSGRPKKALNRWFFGLNVILAAEHGAWKKYDRRWKHADIEFDLYKKIIKPILERYTARTAGAQVEEKDYALVWHYVNVTPELAFSRAEDVREELESALVDTDIGVYSGNNIIEVKPNEISKGHVARELQNRFNADFVMCAGDDYTDEDMFKALEEEAVTIKVGSGETRARFEIEGVTQMVGLLDDMSESSGRGRLFKN